MMISAMGQTFIWGTSEEENDMRAALGVPEEVMFIDKKFMWWFLTPIVCQLILTGFNYYFTFESIDLT